MRCTGLIKKSWNRSLEFGVEGDVNVNNDDELSDGGVADPDLCFMFPGPEAPNTAASES